MQNYYENYGGISLLHCFLPTKQLAIADHAAMKNHDRQQQSNNNITTNKQQGQQHANDNKTNDTATMWMVPAGTMNMSTSMVYSVWSTIL